MLRRIEARLATRPGLLLTGSSYRGISVNHCVKDAERVADEALAHLTRAPAARAEGVR